MHRITPLAPLLLLALPLAAQEAAAPPGPADELGKLAGLVGTWESSGTATRAPGAPASSWTATSTYRWILGGHVLREDMRIRTEDGGMPELVISDFTVFDRQTGRFRTFRSSNTGRVEAFRIHRLEDGTMVSHHTAMEDGRPVVGRWVTRGGQGSMSFVNERAVGDGDFFVHVEGTGRRTGDDTDGVDVAEASAFTPDAAGEAMEELAAMAGTYRFSGEATPSPGAPAIEVEGTSEVRMIFGGTVCEITDVGDPLPGDPELVYESLHHLAWNEDARAYDHFGLDNTGHAVSMTCEWIGDSLVFTGARRETGRPVVERTVIEVDGGGRLRRLYADRIPGTGAPRRIFDATYTRQDWTRRTERGPPALPATCRPHPRLHFPVRLSIGEGRPSTQETTMHTVLSFSSLVLLTSALAAQDDTPAPQLEKLSGLLGTWESSGTVAMAPGEPATEWTSTSTYRWILGGHALREDTRVEFDDDTPDLALSYFMTFDREEDHYQIHGIVNNGSVFGTRLHVTEDGGLVFTEQSIMNGEPVVERWTLEIDGDEMTFGSQRAVGAGDFYTHVSGKGRRTSTDVSDVGVAEASAMIEGPVPEPMQRIARMAGSYAFTGKVMMEPGQPMQEISGSTTVRTIFGGHVCEFIDKGDPLPDAPEGSGYQGIHFMSWNADTGGYDHIALNSMGHAANPPAQWVDGKLVFTATDHYKDHPIAERTVLEIAEDGTIASIFAHVIIGTAEPMKTFEASYTKK